MRVRWWEGLLGVSGFALALLFPVAGELVAAVVLAALVAFTLAHGAQVAERELAGDYARRRAYLGLVESAALFSIYVVICALFVVIAIDHWTSDTHGTVAMYALAGLAFLLLRELQRHGDEAVNWLLGSREEMRAGQELEPLREQGWFVTHNLKMDWGGNLDHLVIGPGGAYAIETKSGRFRRTDAAQAVRGAIWAKQKFGQQWVTAVLCVGTNPPERPEQRGDTWVLSPELLRPWLLARPPRDRRRPKPHDRP